MPTAHAMLLVYAAPRNNVFGGTAATSAAYNGHDQCLHIIVDAKSDLDVQVRWEGQGWGKGCAVAGRSVAVVPLSLCSVPMATTPPDQRPSPPALVTCN